MKKLLYMLMLISGIGTAQTFDFNCPWLPHVDSSYVPIEQDGEWKDYTIEQTRGNESRTLNVSLSTSQFGFIVTEGSGAFGRIDRNNDGDLLDLLQGISIFGSITVAGGGIVVDNQTVVSIHTQGVVIVEDIDP